MEKILFVNSCVRENSRTLELAKSVLHNLKGNVTELRLNNENVQPLDCKSLEKRNKCLEIGDFSDTYFDMAKEFATSDIIVIAMPYWDLSFPAIVKAYFEKISIVGITFKYEENGMPKGLCKAKRLIYVTTAGGFIGDFKFGFDYVCALAKGMYGIGEVDLVKAEGLDIVGADVEEILRQAKEKIK